MRKDNGVNGDLDRLPMLAWIRFRRFLDELASMHFTASAELHTLGALCGSRRREMRDAAGNSGEFHTPCAVVRLMVAVPDPSLGERVLDPAGSTSGFLLQALNHQSEQVKTMGHRKGM